MSTAIKTAPSVRAGLPQSMPAKTKRRKTAEAALSDAIAEHMKCLAELLQGVVSTAKSLPLINKLRDEGFNDLVLAVKAYKKGGPLLFDTPPEIANVIRGERLDDPKAIIECKTQLYLAAIWGWYADEHLANRRIAKAQLDYGGAREALGVAAGIASVLWGNEWISAVSKRGAAAKLLKDPRQHEKVLVKDCWDAWQREPARYTGKAAFARDMLQKFEALKSQAVIARWCRAWAESDSTQRAE